MPVFDALRPDGDRADSFVHVGPVGAGHYAKMVHNGIESGLMQAYAEGYELLAAQESVVDVPAVLRAWSNGAVVRSWLLDLLVQALSGDPELDTPSVHAEDSGEGRWTLEAAIEHAVPAPVISAALFARFASSKNESPAMKAVSALRSQFGRHAVRRAEPVGIG
jgi:6-phosphogluconate dehydrogenase